MNILFYISICVCAGCAVAPVAKPLAAFSNNSEAVIVPPPQVMLTVDPNDRNYLIANYPPGMDPNQFEWRAEVSPDLQRWFYFYQLDGEPIIELPHFVPRMFVRLVGVPWPTPEQP
jgi:hypothetical protein